MFEYVKGRRDSIAISFYCGLAPFGLAWALHQSPITAFALEAYIITIAVFVLDPYEMRKKEVKQPWYWKTMFRVGAILHSTILALLWFVNSSFLWRFTGTGTIFFVAFVLSMVEIVILGETADGSAARGGRGN